MATATEAALAGMLELVDSWEAEAARVEAEAAGTLAQSQAVAQASTLRYCARELRAVVETMRDENARVKEEKISASEYTIHDYLDDVMEMDEASAAEEDDMGEDPGFCPQCGVHWSNHPGFCPKCGVHWSNHPDTHVPVAPPMTRPDHPRLTKVLADAWAYPYVKSFDPGLARELIEGIPPAIADRLERALDVCQHGAETGKPCGLMELNHGPGRSATHPYVPLVEDPTRA